MGRQAMRVPWQAGFLAAALIAGTGSANAGAMDVGEAWRDLAGDIFGERPLEDGSGLIGLEMPYRAEDAAIVPVTIRTHLPAGDQRRVEAITLVIQENPAPVAARFVIGPTSGISAISTRVRVDTYTDVHAVAELSDGKLYAVKTFVKASGGCSAPAMKNADEATASLGQLRFRQFEKPAVSGEGRREAQVMIRHPNNSGLQMDQITRHYIPAFFVDEVTVRQGDDLVLKVEGGISISEDPNVRFDYLPNGAQGFRVEAIDTDGHTFSGEWPIEHGQM